VPELPEVETIRRSLEQRGLGRRIVGLEVRDTRLRTPVDLADLRARVAGATIEAVTRRSKYLLVHLRRGPVLVVHLGMSGRLDLVPEALPLAPHTHVRFQLAGGDELRFADPRRFGMLFLVDRAALGSHPRFARLGPEPLEPGFDAAYLHQRARGRRKPIKNFLMDAAIVVGVGNIYACEALHRAGVHPCTPVRRVSAAVCNVLQRALRHGGTTLTDYRDVDGRYGAFQYRLRVYGRDGLACRRCGRRVRRIVQAGRSTYYCPGCQRR
jgi:formamidopyrimidine-DNA glycosylase